MEKIINLEGPPTELMFRIKEMMLLLVSKKEPNLVIDYLNKKSAFSHQLDSLLVEAGFEVEEKETVLEWHELHGSTPLETSRAQNHAAQALIREELRKFVEEFSSEHDLIK